MEKETTTQTSAPTQAPAQASAPSTVATPAQPSAPKAVNTERKFGQRRSFGGNRDNKKRGPRRGGGEKFKPEFDQKILGIRRVTRVVAGGRRFNFSVSIVAGDHKGRVGVGIGKAGDTALAIEKAFNNAKKNMVTINMTEDKSIPHDVQAKYCSSVLLVMPAPGKGLVAGSAVRSVLDMAGMTDVSAKMLSRSKNPINNARVAVKALSGLAVVPKKKKAKTPTDAEQAPVASKK